MFDEDDWMIFKSSNINTHAVMESDTVHKNVFYNRKHMNMCFFHLLFPPTLGDNVTNSMLHTGYHYCFDVGLMKLGNNRSSLFFQSVFHHK